MKLWPRSRWARALFVYLLLLAASHLYRAWRSHAPVPKPGQHVVTLPASGVQVAYRDEGRAGPTLLLLHGTPMAGESFDRLLPELTSHARVLVPDLPGFGRSTRNLSDYSIRAHAKYMLDFMSALGVSSVQVVGYSQGGGVALDLAALAPERVASLTLLSSIGVQELELLGDYHLNHGLYALQLGFLTAVEEGLPHFGFLDDDYLNVAYARNFYDSDQRPLRGILSNFQGPMLIIQGKKDRLVPPSAAEEHARLVPQSEMVWLDGGHGLIFSQPAAVAAPLLDFVERVDAGRGTVRAMASAERTRRAAEPFDWRSLPPAEGLARWLALLLLVVVSYITEDLTCIAAGLMVARGFLGFVPATLACGVGIVSGDMLLFLAGKYLGQPVLHKRPFRWFIKEAGLARSREWVERRGPGVILASRFFPGARLPTYVVAGMLGMPLRKFSLYFLVAALLWTPLLVGAAALLGREALNYLQAWSRYSLLVAVLLALVLYLTFHVVLPAFTFRGRRLLISSWRRLIHWEFWPPWVFYPPVVLYALYLGLRHRSLTLFTAANPAMPAGGVLGESKMDILDALKDAGEFVARAERVRPGTKPDLARVSYPVVVKPDRGERGKGVRVLHSEEELVAHLAGLTEDVMVQEFAPGREFGLFYYRRPGDETGAIFSVTDKTFLSVTGDGRHTLEELILRDERAVCMARFFLGRHAGRLYEIPGRGEEVQLVDIGTHCRGAVFRDGAWVLTPTLLEAIDRISRTYEGFYFGRYDIRTPDVDAFRRGENFKIVELNGVTSEATHIYDPANSLWAAYRILARQWRLAFEIGAANRARGTKPLSPAAFLRLLWRGGR